MNEREVWGDISREESARVRSYANKATFKQFNSHCYMISVAGQLTWKSDIAPRP